jgi:bifunctional DNA-binding transcriptional regulator/antitoxin component of YhaV-PrlF toxin-antitoxin module
MPSIQTRTVVDNNGSRSVTIPSDICDDYSIDEGDDVAFVVRDDGDILVLPAAELAELV